MSQTETEKRKPSIAPAAPPKRQPEAEPQETEEEDMVAQLRAKLTDSRDTIGVCTVPAVIRATPEDGFTLSARARAVDHASRAVRRAHE